MRKLKKKNQQKCLIKYYPFHKKIENHQQQHKKKYFVMKISQYLIK